jgi:hypothetical protein
LETLALAVSVAEKTTVCPGWTEAGVAVKESTVMVCARADAPHASIVNEISAKNVTISIRRLAYPPEWGELATPMNGTVTTRGVIDPRSAKALITAANITL